MSQAGLPESHCVFAGLHPSPAPSDQLSPDRAGGVPTATPAAAPIRWAPALWPRQHPSCTEVVSCRQRIDISFRRRKLGAQSTQVPFTITAS